MPFILKRPGRGPDETAAELVNARSPAVFRKVGEKILRQKGVIDFHP